MFVKDKPPSHSVNSDWIAQWFILANWVAPWFILYKQKKCPWAPFTLPPITFSGVDQAPNQRLVSLYIVLSHQVVRSFIVVHSTSDPLVARRRLSLCFLKKTRVEKHDAFQPTTIAHETKKAHKRSLCKLCTTIAAGIHSTTESSPCSHN